MPRIIYGTAWKAEKTQSLVVAALRAGFRGIDTACQPKHYNESGVGAALREVAAEVPRDEIYLQTKFTPLSGQDLSKPIPYDAQAPLPQQARSSPQPPALRLVRRSSSISTPIKLARSSYLWHGSVAAVENS